MSKADRQPLPEPLEPAVGAMIFASDEPVRPEEIAAALGEVELREVREAIRSLEQELERAGVGLCLEWIAGGVRLATRSEVGPWVRQFVRHRNRTRLSLPALETLAITAYRQPITAPEIQAIRGKDPSAAIKGLLEKRLLRCLGRKKVIGSPMLYGTTKHFLVHFGLNSLDDLPSIEEFDQFLGALEELEATAAPEAAAEEVTSEPSADEGGPEVGKDG